MFDSLNQPVSFSCCRSSLAAWRQKSRKWTSIKKPFDFVLAWDRFCVPGAWPGLISQAADTSFTLPSVPAQSHFSLLILPAILPSHAATPGNMHGLAELIAADLSQRTLALVVSHSCRVYQWKTNRLQPWRRIKVNLSEPVSWECSDPPKWQTWSSGSMKHRSQSLNIVCMNMC